MPRKPKNILIVGGGTAGWMAANLMQHQWAKHNIDITVIDSSIIGTVGVGEGTTPFIQDFFKRLGIEENEWMAAANATYKCGISFPGWTQDNEASYFHPFYSHIDNEQVPTFFSNADLRREGIDAHAHPDDYFVTSALTKAMRSPVPLNPVVNQLDYGYHFDAELLGCFLKEKALSRGVKHIDDKVIDVSLTESGDINSVFTEGSGAIHADFFVDCTGFKGLLIQGALGESLIPCDEQLFNDSAIAIQTPITADESIRPETVSKALKHGWAWQIPLSNRYGNGYVYSSKYVSKEEAEQEFREILGEDAKGRKALHLKWQPGRIDQHWKGNCVAIGLSQGFLEPLEAPMLNIIQRTCEQFVASFEGADFTCENRDQFNRDINGLIDGTKDYLQAHYLLNSRTDTQYWIDCRENLAVSADLKGILTGWIENLNFDQVLRAHLNNPVYLKTSWYCILAGMEHFKPISRPASKIARRSYERARSRAQQQIELFVPHHSQLAKVYQGT